MSSSSKLDLVTIGETMLRLGAPVGESLERAAQLDVEIAGAESNVAVAFSRLGHRAGWVSRLPANALGRLVVNRIREHGVDTSRVLWADRAARLGLYFWESNTRPRTGRVIYDRLDSAFARIDPEQVDWDYVETARRLHLTGITPVLSEACRRLVKRALGVARAAGQVVSFDINYRSSLIPAPEAAATFEELLHGIDVLFASARDASTVFGLNASPEEQAGGLARRFGARVVVLTMGGEGAAALEDGHFHRAPALQGVEVDRIGRGDAFVAGFLHGTETGGAEQGLHYGTALAALKQTYRGDLVWTTAEELNTLVEADERELER
jgi:2-dehydro-3-deoxygluconokinase